MYAIRSYYGTDAALTIQVPDPAGVEKIEGEPYFVPESTKLHVQLLNFQKEKRRIGTVITSYSIHYTKLYEYWCLMTVFSI